ncbi:MAG: hypothetical protein ACKEQI_00425, partial [Candidatus Hodgkinia cicadicola]
MVFMRARRVIKRESAKDQSRTFVRLVLNLRLARFPEKLVSLPLNGLVRSLIMKPEGAPTGANEVKVTNATARCSARTKASAVEVRPQLPSNGTSLGAASKLIQVLRNPSVALGRCPELTLGEVKQMIANLFKVNPNNLTLGNGSDELLSALCALLLKEGDEAIV